ncbi:DUF2218 domain-containing protein [Leisingera sp. ANG-M7]|uniref:DUF2218 domain-containing protein n=1 Tax=Leisingera sp. ANG-M7 TaxID=1577902 RepID=UPI00057D3E42|nr:DUF2218 domain-containing protein [Leisingera sp. ANG-M7]KIC34184.1 2,4-dihydroxyhept-2-ene-1,7-dioic acid aldolase [Leisingera sp. ANG-M7]
MLTDQGRFETPNASRYLQQLCKHFAHKVPVDHDETRGTVALGMGPATLQATENTLTAEVTAPDAADLAEARDIIDRHLARFAFREAFEAMDWQSATA